MGRFYQNYSGAYADRRNPKLDPGEAMPLVEALREAGDRIVSFKAPRIDGRYRRTGRRGTPIPPRHLGIGESQQDAHAEVLG